MGNLNSRINKITNRVNEIHREQNDTIEQPCGVWYKDENGKVIPNSGQTQRVAKDEIHGCGVLAVPKPMSKSQWQESAKKQQQQKQPEIKFCSNCGSYVHPELGNFEIDEQGGVRILCSKCLG